MKGIMNFIFLILQFIGEVFFDVQEQPISRPSERSNTESNLVANRSFLWFCAGGGLGWLSSSVLPTMVLSSPGLRLANLVIAPLVFSTVAFHLAKGRARVNPNIVPWNCFWYSFFFTLAFVGARFASSVSP